MTLRNTVLLMTKPPIAGQVKSRLIGPLTAEEAAELQAAFLGDLVERLVTGHFTLIPVWALADVESVPAVPPGGLRQRDGDLGMRLRASFTEQFFPADSSTRSGLVVAIGSDLPHLTVERIKLALAHLAAGADVVLGPAADGGYYLIGLRASSLGAPLFEGIAWSTAAVLEQTLTRCRENGLAVALLPEEADIDTGEDLARFEKRLAAGDLPACPRTSALFERWERAAGVPSDRPSTEAPGACAS